jgi:hypothetical protein
MQETFMNSAPKPVVVNAKLSKAYATLLLDGDEDPAFWTEYFAVEPDILVVKGQPFRLPSGRMSSGPGRVGVWGRWSKSAVKSDTLDPHIQYLIGLLGLPRSGLPELLSKRETSMRVSCYWLSDANEDPVVESELEEIVKHSGGTIEIDKYLKQETDSEPDHAG